MVFTVENGSPPEEISTSVTVETTTEQILTSVQNGESKTDVTVVETTRADEIITTELHTEKDVSDEYVSEVLDKVDSNFLQNIIDSALDEIGVDSIGTLDEKQFENFKGNIESAFDDYDAVIENTVSDKQSFEQIYDSAVKDNFIESVINYVDSEDIASIIDEKLDSFGVNSFDKLKENQKEEFANEVIEELNDNGADIKEDSLKRADKFQVIEQLYEEIKPEEKISVLPVVIIALVCAAAVVTVVAVKNYKKKFEEERT